MGDLAPHNAWAEAYAHYRAASDHARVYIQAPHAVGHLYRSSATPQPSDSVWMIPAEADPATQKRQCHIDRLKALTIHA